MLTPNASTSHAVALIGRGIGQSRSPAIHESAARDLGLPLTYRLVDFARLGWDDGDLERVVHLLGGMDYAGSNVTYPFKQQVMPLCDTLSAEAQALGAVNTLVFEQGKVRGENTDWIGFSWMIERAFGCIKGASVAQIGTGGAGSATALALARLGAAEVALFDPAPGRAQALAERLGSALPTCRFTVAESAAAAIEGRDGVVNATPIGMASVPGLPFKPALMTAEQWLGDIIYFPLETPLLAAARAQGQRVANGVAMVVGQAAQAFAHFTGVMPDRDAMLARLLADIAVEAKEAV